MPGYHRSLDGVWRVCEAETPASCGIKGGVHLSDADYNYLQTSMAFKKSIEKAKDAELRAAAPKRPRVKYSPSRKDMPLAPIQLDMGPANEWFKSHASVGIREIDTRLHVAPEGYSGKFCDCGTYFKQDDFENASRWGELPCPSCGKLNMENGMLSDLCSSELKYLDDETVRTAHWFHVTERADWAEGTKAEGIITHLGSREAAHHRLAHIVSNGEAESEQFYVYEVRLKPQAPIAGGLLKDQGTMWPEDTTEIGMADSKYPYLQHGGVARYLNEYEGPGTVSLVADPDSYEIVGRAAVPMANAKQSA
jgi:hypothetical protein